MQERQKMGHTGAHAKVQVVKNTRVCCMWIYETVSEMISPRRECWHEQAELCVCVCVCIFFMLTVSNNPPHCYTSFSRVGNSQLSNYSNLIITHIFVASSVGDEIDGADESRRAFDSVQMQLATLTDAAFTLLLSYILCHREKHTMPTLIKKKYWSIIQQ